MSKLSSYVNIGGFRSDSGSNDDEQINPGSAPIGNSKDKVLAFVKYPEPYVQPLIVKALQDVQSPTIEIVEGNSMAHDPGRQYVVFAAYENLDFETAMQNSKTSLICAYVIRKALIRKHYLSNTIAAWLTKHPESVLKNHFKASIHFELDYAEFLDDALVDAWDLHESMERNSLMSEVGPEEWWILKPGMSDGGNGIRMFSNIEQLQSIFEEWDPPSDDEDADEVAEFDDPASTPRIAADNEHPMTSQLRHFIAQPYIDQPLLLPSYASRKFHIRTYVLAVGALKIFVYREMLALFAAKPYEMPRQAAEHGKIDLSQHLTNTCFQDESTKDSSVHRFWDLQDSCQQPNWRESILSQICLVTGEVFEAAAREQMVHFQAIPNAFEIFGVDFLVDHSSNVWLLELNAYPDFKQTGSVLQDVVIGGLFDGVVQKAVLPFFSIEQKTSDDDQMMLVKEIDLGRR